MNSKLNSRRLYVRNLRDTTTEDELRSFFAQYGIVTGVLLKRDRATGLSKGFAYIEMATALETKRAITYGNDQIFNDRQIKVLRVNHR